MFSKKEYSGRNLLIKHMILYIFKLKDVLLSIPSGSAFGLVGTGMMIAGTVISLTGVGAVVGTPLALAGAAVGGAGGNIFILALKLHIFYPYIYEDILSLYCCIFILPQVSLFLCFNLLN